MSTEVTKVPQALTFIRTNSAEVGMMQSTPMASSHPSNKKF